MPNVTTIGSYAFSGAAKLSYAGFNLPVDVQSDAFWDTMIYSCSPKNLSACGSCGDGYVMPGRGCVSDCGEGYTTNIATKRCVKNQDPQPTADDCTIDGKMLQGKKCVTSCGDWYAPQDGVCVPDYETIDDAIVIDDDMEPITEDIFDLADSDKKLNVICRGDADKCEDILSSYSVPFMLDMSGMGASGSPRSVGGSGNPIEMSSDFPALIMDSADVKLAKLQNIIGAVLRVTTRAAV